MTTMVDGRKVALAAAARLWRDRINGPEPWVVTDLADGLLVWLHSESVTEGGPGEFLRRVAALEAVAETYRAPGWRSEHDGQVQVLVVLAQADWFRKWLAPPQAEEMHAELFGSAAETREHRQEEATGHDVATG